MGHEILVLGVFHLRGRPEPSEDTEREAKLSLASSEARGEARPVRVLY